MEVCRSCLFFCVLNGLVVLHIRVARGVGVFLFCAPQWTGVGGTVGSFRVGSGWVRTRRDCLGRERAEKDNS